MDSQNLPSTNEVTKIKLQDGIIFGIKNEKLWRIMNVFNGVEEMNNGGRSAFERF